MDLVDLPDKELKALVVHADQTLGRVDAVLAEAQAVLRALRQLTEALRDTCVKAG